MILLLAFELDEDTHGKVNIRTEKPWTLQILKPPLALD